MEISLVHQSKNSGTRASQDFFLTQHINRYIDDVFTIFETQDYNNTRKQESCGSKCNKYHQLLSISRQAFCFGGHTVNQLRTFVSWGRHHISPSSAVHCIIATAYLTSNMFSTISNQAGRAFVAPTKFKFSAFLRLSGPTTSGCNPVRGASAARKYQQQIRPFSSLLGGNESGNANKKGDGRANNSVAKIIERMGQSLQQPAGPLYGKDILDEEHSEGHQSYIPQVALHGFDGRHTKRVLV